MSLPIPLSPVSSSSSQTSNPRPINQGLLNYSLFLQQESDVAVTLYRNVVLAIGEDGERFPIPEYTLECLRQAAWDSINQWRLSQIALIASTYDHNLQAMMASSCERVESMDNRTMAVLGIYHDACLENLNEEAVRPHAVRLHDAHA